MAPTHHAIDYLAFTALDLPAVKAFSTAAFDWRLNDYAPGYAGIVAPGGTGEISGFNATGDGRAGGNPLVLLYSDDLDATVEAVRAPGVTIATGPYEFPGGRRFHFTDPSGNELGVWQAAESH